MLTPTAPASIAVLDAWRDHTVRITFRPVDPLGITEVVIDPEPCDNGRLVQLIQAAIVRLLVYHRDFLAAAAQDAAPVPPGGSADGRAR